MTGPRRGSGAALRAGMVALALAGLAAGAMAAPSAGAAEPHRVDPQEFQANVDHPYFPLVPGTTFEFAERRGSQVSENTVTVTRESKVILGVTCVVVHDVLRHKGVVVEDTFDWYAQDRRGNVWYFGEATREIHKNGKVDREGSWEAGVDGAEPGIIMPAVIAPGAPYRQEYLRGHAEDMGQIVAVGELVSVPAGKFADCVRTKEWSMLEAGSERKWYAKGVGFVRSESSDFEVSTLVSATPP